MNTYEKGVQETVADRLFKKALQQYHSNLLTTYANVSNVSFNLITAYLTRIHLNPSQAVDIFL